MAKKLYEEASVQDIAVAIREKTGGAETYKVAQMGNAVRAIPSKDNIVHADIPDYIKTAALEVAKKVQAVRTSESIVFIAASDAHQLDTSADIVAGNKHAGMAMKALAYILPGIDFACYLGDYTAGGPTTTLAEGRQHFAEINADIDEAFEGIPQFRTLGNHDSLQYSKAQNGSVLSASELYDLCGSYNTGAVMGSTTEGYCYRDFDSKKLRVICLNTAEATEKEYVSDAQKLWFANTLKAVGAKTGWNVLILSHHPLDWGGVCILSNIVKAYVDGGSITVSSGNTVNFSGSNSAKFLGAFHGHVHCFKAAKLNYIANSVGTEYQAYRIAAPNMCFSRNNEYGQNNKAEYYGIEFGENTTYNKTAGTANDTAFVVNVVNPSEEKIYSFCYGAGYDREIFTGTVIIPTTGITLDQTSGTLTEGNTVTLTATVIPDNATYKTVTWETSNSTVATVADGVVTALMAGTATITAKTADGFTASYTLTVEAAQVNYTNLVPTAQAVGSTDPYNGTGYCDGKYLSTGASPWEGSDSACVLTGNIPYVIPTTGLPKTIYIKGAAWEAISHCRMCFFVENKNSICGPMITGSGSGNSALSKYFTVETLGDKYIKLTPIASASGTNSMLVSTVASSANARFVRFSLKGTGANLIITMDEPIVIITVPVTGITLDKTSGTLAVGDTVTLTATVLPSDASNKAVTWDTSDSSVATVVNGVVTALSSGTAVITARTTDGDYTASYTLTVESQTIDLLTAYGYADNTRLSTGSGSEKEQADYVTVGHTSPIPIDNTRYPNGAIIRVTGAVNCLGNNYVGSNNGGASAWVLYTTGGTTFSQSSYIETKTQAVGTITIDEDKTGFTLDLASLAAPRYLKFCVRGVGANITATLTPK